MSKWYSLKELKRARTPMLLDSVTGLPDNHVITVVERVISVDDPELIQNNVRTDTFTLNLDAEYDDLNVVVIFTKPNNINVKVAYNGTPTHIPGSAMELVGSLACSVVGIDADGEVRAVTKAAPDTFQVVKSGAYDGSVTSDDAELLGQILQAVSDAEAAITEAETATTAATNATSQATSAATSANQAASSANSAASSANSAATKANSAAVNAENAYETLQPYMATIDSCANILHREVGPDAVVTADDSFPCKPVEMVVYGNTVQNLWVNPSGTHNGVTATSNADGSITVSGTATGGTAGIQTSDAQSRRYILKPNTQYTLSVDKLISEGFLNSGFQIYIRDSNGTSVGGAISVGYRDSSVTFTTSSNMVFVNMGFALLEGHTVSGTYRVMLNEGSEPEPWCPPGLNSVGQLREDEKNLWVNPQGSANGITVTNNDDGSITLEGTATTTGSFALVNTTLKRYTNYVWTIDHAMDTNVYFAIFYGSTYQNVGRVMRSNTFTTDSNVSNARFAVYAVAGGTVSGTYRIVLAEGSSAPPWTPSDAESAVYVNTSGKNLFDFHDPGSNVTRNGIRFDVMEDGSVRINGTSTRRAQFNYTSKRVFPAGTYTLSGAKDGEANANIAYIVKGESTIKYFDGYEYNGTQTKTFDKPFTVSSFMVDVRNAGATVDTILYPQFERSDTATDYEPPNITTTPIDLQGHTLNALPDGTRDELHIDGGGNVVLEKRVAARIATEPGVIGGTTDRTNYTTSNSEGSIPWDNIEDANTNKNRTLCDKFPSFSGGDRRIGYYNASPSTSANLLSVFSGNSNNASKSVGDGQLPITLLYACEPQTIDLGTITPPTMAAPNVTAYVADDTPAEMELDYVRDINIVVDRLEKKVADLVVTEATIV